MGLLDRIGFLAVLEHPIADLAIGDRFFNYLDELLFGYAGGFEPEAIKAFAKVGLVIRVKFACQVKPDFINQARQMHPATHGFARTPRVNDVAHAE